MQFSNLPKEVQYLFIFAAIAWQEISTGRIKDYPSRRYVSQFNPKIRQYFYECPFIPQLKNFLCLVIIFSLVSCAGLSRQMKATTEGIKIDYYVKQEKINTLDAPINIEIVDDRIDKDVIGYGAKSTMGDRFIGYFAFGVFYAVTPDRPSIQDKEDINNMFDKAFTQRFEANGVEISKDSDSKNFKLIIYLRHFRIDFRSAKWIGEVGYIAKLKKDDKLVYEQIVNKKIKKFNMYGYGTAEETISEAFNQAVNALNLDSIKSP